MEVAAQTDQPARRMSLELALNAEEDARFEAGLATTPVESGCSSGSTWQHRRLPLARRPFPARFRPGRYTLRVQIKAEMNGARKSRFSSQLHFTGRH